MVSNAETITICHKEIDPSTRLENWTKYYYNNCWWFDVLGTVVRDGYQYNNRVEIRIPYSKNKTASISNISIGDILYRGRLESVVESQADVPNAYNITSITNNTFGGEPHIHLGGS